MMQSTENHLSTAGKDGPDIPDLTQRPAAAAIIGSRRGIPQRAWDGF